MLKARQEAQSGESLQTGAKKASVQWIQGLFFDADTEGDDKNKKAEQQAKNKLLKPFEEVAVIHIPLDS